MPAGIQHSLFSVNSDLHNFGASYGSDPSGLICGYRFIPGSATRSVGCADALAWLEERRGIEGSEFVWLHFALTNVNSEKWMRAHLRLPNEYFSALHAGDGSSRVELAGDHLVAVINDVLYEFAYDVSDIATLWICVGKNYIVSARVKSLRSVDRLRLSVRDGEQFSSPIMLLSHLLRDQADVLTQIEREAGAKVDQIEDHLLIGRLTAKRNTLGSLRRVLLRLRRLLAPEPGAMARLLSRPPLWFSNEDARELSLAIGEFSSVLNDLNGLQERTKLLQEEIVSHATEQTNRSVYLLTIVTVVALPINIISGLLGMNVGGIPLARDPDGFWVIAVIVAIFTGVAAWVAFFKQRD